MSAQRCTVILLYDSEEGSTHLATDSWGEILKFGQKQEATGYLNNVVLKQYPGQKFLFIDVPIPSW